MNRTRKRRRRRYTRRRRGGFKFKRPKFKTPKFKMPKMNITKKLGKMKDMGKKGLGAVGKVGKMGMGALGKAGKMGMGALKTPLGIAGGLGGLAFLASSMGGFPMEKLKYFAKFGGMAIAPLLLLLGFIKPGAQIVYHGLKKVVTMAVHSGKGGMSFLINLGGIPIKGLMTIISHLPTMMLGIGGFASIAFLVGKNYFSWIWKSWRYIVDGWSSSPLLTWCEKKVDGTCRCPQILKIKKENGKPVIVIEKAQNISSQEGKGCFMNRQCPSGYICKKLNKWNPRGKCTQTSIPDIMPGSSIVTPPAAAVEPLVSGKKCFMNKQCPSGFICKKKNKWSPRGKCTQSSTESVVPIEATKPLVSGKKCFMNKQCPSGFICKKKNKWSPRGKCTQSSIPTSPMAGGGKIKFNMTIEAKITKNGIKWKVKNSRRKTRRRKN